MTDAARHNQVDLAIARAGGPSAVGRALGITPQAVGQWQRIPAERVLEISRLSGVPPHDLRPDIYPDPAATPEAAS